MERYFIIEKDSDIYKDYVQYLEDVQSNTDLFKKFAAANGIKATQFVPRKDALLIIPTDEDMAVFEEQFITKAYDSNIRSFKKTSAIGKLWKDTVKDVIMARKPTYWEYGMNLNGRFTSRIFKIKDTVYGSVETGHEFDLLPCMKELKASEFWKIVEEFEAEQRAGGKDDTDFTQG